MKCLNCHAETTNGLALCALCQRYASDCLEYLPIYFRNLARWRRPARPNGSLGTSGQWLMRRGESEGSHIATALDLVANDLDARARMLTDDRDIVPATGDTDAETVTALCLFLEVHLTSIATLDWAGDLVREIGRHETMLRTLTETAVPGWYSGACQRVTGRDMEGNQYRCGAATYVVPGLTWATCTSCGLTTYAPDHLPIVLEEARDWVSTPVRLAEAVVALTNAEVSVEDLRKRIAIWGKRGHLEVIRPNDFTEKKYRLGEVLDHLATQAEAARATPA